MKRKHLFCLAASVFIIFLSTVASAHAYILDFEGLPDNKPVINGYGGLNWSNMFIHDRTCLDAGYNYSGYVNGIVSGTNVAYNGFSNMAITSVLKSTFDFEGAWFTSAWFDNNQLTVLGFYGKKLVGSVEMTLNKSTPQWLDASFTNIDKLVFYTKNGGNYHFVMDNFTYTPHFPSPVVPIPAAIYLLGAGLAGLAGLKKRKQDHALRR